MSERRNAREAEQEEPGRTDGETMDGGTRVPDARQFIEGEVNVKSGDFIGRDYLVVQNVPPPGGDAAIGPGATATTVIDVVAPEKLRGRITRAVTVAESLELLRRNTYHDNYSRFRSIMAWITGVRLYQEPAREDRSSARFRSYLKDLRELEARDGSGAGGGVRVSSAVSSTFSTQERPATIQALGDEVNVAIAGLHSDFTGFVRAAAATPDITTTLVSDIARVDLKRRAEAHQEAIHSLWEELDHTALTDEAFDVLGDKAIGAIKLLTEIEQRKVAIARLRYLDQRRNNLTVAAVLIYIALLIGAFGWIIWRVSTLPPAAQASFNTLELPLIGIPAAVLIWSLIGSFAAMLIRFNREPVSNFGFTVKWLLTRPVQGVILGAAFYVVLISGLFVLTGDETPVNPGSPTDEIILVLSFLVGFSDRFADTVFDTLLRRFSSAEAEADGGRPEVVTLPVSDAEELTPTGQDEG